MKHLPLLLLLIVGVVALLAGLAPQIASAQLEPTPILGEPVVVTPLVTSAPAPDLPVEPALGP